MVGLPSLNVVGHVVMESKYEHDCVITLNLSLVAKTVLVLDLLRNQDIVILSTVQVSSYWL